MAAEIRWKRTFATFLTGGAVGVFLAPVIAPALGRWSRPAVKAALRAGIAVYEQGRQRAAELREMVEDTAADLAVERERNGDAEVSPRRAARETNRERAPMH